MRVYVQLQRMGGSEIQLVTVFSLSVSLWVSSGVSACRAPQSAVFPERRRKRATRHTEGERHD